MARTKNAKVPEVGAEVPEFNLPSAQGGSLRLGMRTVRGPVIVAFFRGTWSDEDVSFFKALAAKEDEINLALGNIVGVGVVESSAARVFLKATGMKSYILYDYAKVATPAWGLLEKDGEHGEFARPATFLIDSDNKVVEAWTDARPRPDDLLAKVSSITGLPKEPDEEDEEKPKKARAAKKADGDGGGENSSEKPKREKLSPEEREKQRAERKAARESDEKAESKSGDGAEEGASTDKDAEPKAKESDSESAASGGDAKAEESSTSEGSGSKSEGGSEGEGGESGSEKKEG